MKNEKIAYLVIGIIIGIIAIQLLLNFRKKDIDNENQSPIVTTAGPGEHCGGNMTTALSCSLHAPAEAERS